MGSAKAADAVETPSAGRAPPPQVASAPRIEPAYRRFSHGCRRYPFVSRTVPVWVTKSLMVGSK